MAKAVREKKRANLLDCFVSFTGSGYNSDCLLAWMDERLACLLYTSTNVAGLDIAFPGVEQYHPDFYPLRMMALLLSYGKGSPFYKVLVEERKLTSYTNVATSAFELAGQISLSAKAFRGGNLNDIYKGMQEAFRRFETEEIKDSDLERLKIMQETMMYNVMMALESKTQALARNNVFGGSPDRSVEELSKYKACLLYTSVFYKVVIR